MASGTDKHGKLLETPIQASILDNLRVRGIFAWRNQKGIIPIRRGRKIVGQRKSDPMTNGMPDILAVHAGKLYAIEVKRERGGTQSDDQKHWQYRLETAGAVYLIARSWNDVATTLLEYGLPITL